MERLTGIKPTLGYSDKAELYIEQVLLLLWNKVRHLEGCKVNVVCFLGMSSGWRIGGIQITEISLTW